jgi:hypothetical protein
MQFVWFHVSIVKFGIFVVSQFENVYIPNPAERSATKPDEVL